MNAINYYNDPAGLVAEHYDGRYSGLLNMASDFVVRFYATHGAASESDLAEAALEEGFAESEIAAALCAGSGEYPAIYDPRGRFWSVK
jgi:hypothetical protein